MKEDRFLIGILIGVLVVIIVALGVFFLRDSENKYLDEATPDAVVLNYVLALQSEDYSLAYSYLPAEYQDQKKPTLTQFRSNFSYDQAFRVGIKVISVEVENDHAWVEVETVQSGGGLFGGVYRSNDIAVLVLDDNQEWKLIYMPYPFWGWDWFNGVKIIR